MENPRNVQTFPNKIMQDYSFLIFSWKVKALLNVSQEHSMSRFNEKIFLQITFIKYQLKNTVNVKQNSQRDKFVKIGVVLLLLE